MTERLTMEDRLGGGELDGYWQQPALNQGMLMDEAMTSRCTCRVCGWKGLTAEFWVSESGSSCRGFGICPECGHAEEF